jgi:acetolactate synthase small subunit
MDLKITIPRNNADSINITPLTNTQLESYIGIFNTLEEVDKHCIYIQKRMILEEQSLLRKISPKEHRQEIIRLNQIFKALISVRQKMLYEK